MIPRPPALYVANLFKVIQFVLIIILIILALLKQVVSTVDYSSIHPRVPGLKDLHLIGLMPITGDIYPVGVAMAPMVPLAMADIGTRTNLLPGYRLIIHMADTQVHMLLLLPLLMPAWISLTTQTISKDIA